jgi:probable metal-binding protein
MAISSTHGHELLNHVLDMGGSESLPTLRQWAQSTHGPEARYHTCSAQELTFDGLLQFLLDRNKIEINSGRLRVIADHVCADEADSSTSNHVAHA